MSTSVLGLDIARPHTRERDCAARRGRERASITHFVVPCALMYAQTSDEELMLAYARGDVRAFDALYARQRGMLYRYILRGVRERAVADELFQETWSRA